MNTRAQDSHILNGLVLDSITDKPIYGVSIYISKDKIIGSTDKNGEFGIHINSGSPTLSFSFLGYERKTVNIERLHPNDKLIIKLAPAYHEMKEVSINADKNRPVYKNRVKDVLDYEFFMDGLLILVNDIRYKTSLLFEDKQNDTIGLLRLASTSQRLYRDCSDNVFLVSDDGVNQVVYENKKLQILDKISKETFAQEITPCVQQSALNYYYEETAYNGYVTSCYFSHKDTIAFQPICDLYDKRKIDMYKSEMRYVAKLQGDPSVPDYYVDMEKKYAKYIMCRPVYCPLFVVNDTVCIFNHFKGVIQKYDANAHLLNEVSIDYQKDKGWMEKLLKDDITGKVYAVFHHGSRYSLQNVRLNDGRTTGEFTIDYPFPENIKVHNGEVYFLYEESADKNVSLIKFATNN